MGGSWSSDEIPGGGTEGYHVLRVKTVTREKNWKYTHHTHAHVTTHMPNLGMGIVFIKSTR